jgi:hypothetical protein
VSGAAAQLLDHVINFRHTPSNLIIRHNLLNSQILANPNTNHGERGRFHIGSGSNEQTGRRSGSRGQIEQKRKQIWEYW